MAQTLLVTLPGSPNFYYGVELGLDGGEDPANRGPMRWEQATDDNPYLLQFKSLTKLRKQNRAMRIGNYRSVISKDLFAFERYTDKALETVFVFANPSERAVRESLMIRNHKLMNGTKLVDLFSGNEVAEIRSGVVTLDIPPQSIWVLKPVDYEMEWTPYERIY
jgi:glycosidase